MENITQSIEKIKKLFLFYTNNIHKDKLYLLFSRKANKENLALTNPRLLNEIHGIIKDNYPNRSNLNSLGIEPQALNPKFCKDGYMYVLRGDFDNCEGGFYSLQYALTGKNVEQLCQELTNKEAEFLCTRHEASLRNNDLPPSTLSVFLERQTKSGGAPFISVTTSFNSATSFASAKKGSIYILKVKTSDIIKSPTKVITGFEEVEYLIPDYVDMTEIIAKFDYKDYLQIKDYLTNVIGLEIDDIDLLPEIFTPNGNFTYNELLKMGVNLPGFEEQSTIKNSNI